MLASRATIFCATHRGASPRTRRAGHGGHEGLFMFIGDSAIGGVCAAPLQTVRRCIGEQDWSVHARRCASARSIETRRASGEQLRSILSILPTLRRLWGRLGSVLYTCKRLRPASAALRSVAISLEPARHRGLFKRGSSKRRRMRPRRLPKTQTYLGERPGADLPPKNCTIWARRRPVPGKKRQLPEGPQ